VKTGDAWIDLQRTLEKLDCFGAIASLIGENAEQIPGVGPLRLAGQYAVVTGRGFFGASCAMVLYAEVELSLAARCQESRPLLLHPDRVRARGETIRSPARDSPARNKYFRDWYEAAHASA
jgi:hypothetical protein